RQPAGAAPSRGIVGLLLSPPLLLMFVFYSASSAVSVGLQSFSNSAFMDLYDVDLVHANAALASFLWGTAIGVLGGGVIADRMNRFDLITTIAYVIGAALLALLGMAVLPFGSAGVALFFTGFMIGAVMPSRDLIVRTVTPAGS